jgi:hypothetical protein
VRRLIPILCAGALIALVAVPVATAAPDGADGAEAATALAEFERLQVVSYDTTSGTVRSRGTAADGCRIEVKKTTAEAAGSIDLFWIKQRLAWCWKTVHGVSWVTGPWWTPVCKGRDYGITSAGIGWEWAGWVDCYGAGGKGKHYVKRYTKGSFKLCYAICVQTGFPWASVRGNDQGGVTKNGGGVG